MNFIVLTMAFPMGMAICNSFFMLGKVPFHELFFFKTIFEYVPISPKSIFVNMNCIRQSEDDVSMEDLQLPIAGTACSLLLLFAMFYVGQRLHSSLMDLYDVIYQLEWYRYPRKVQRLLLFTMMRAQQPFYISAYGVMPCDLENFLGVSANE